MPRKTGASGEEWTDEDTASMRPRPDAAENAGPRATPRGGFFASMRPRPDAAENHTVRGAECRAGHLLQ